MATQNPYSDSLLMDALRGSLSNAESLGRGFAVAPVGLLGDINALARQYVTPRLPQGVQSLLESAPAAPTTEQILSNIPRVSQPRMETAGMEQLGAAMNPRGPVDLAKGVGRVAGNAINEAMVYDRGLLAGITPQPNRIFVPASSDEAMKASRMLKTMSPQDVWRDTGIGKYAGEYVKEISDQGAKFNTAEQIAADAQKIRERNVALKKTIKESQSTYPDLFPKELTAARRPLREEIKSNQGLLERSYGYEADPKYTGNLAQIAYEHPSLYEIYPELKGVVIGQGRELGDYLGSYELRPSQKVGRIEVSKLGLLSNPRSTATHEMQHAVQELAGFQGGGSTDEIMRAAFIDRDAINAKIDDLNKQMRQVVGTPEYDNLMEQRMALTKEYLDKGYSDMSIVAKQAYDKYQRLAGEAQARLAQTRLDLTPEERLQYYPFAQGKYGLDVSPDELIFDEGLLGR